ncbi:MotA/TolQ/ExbB proton channel family protein [Thiorhodospira sibirica]|uniref:MotA/TolQ/ExbB proton channel family protein n=1 Tax=Thiorhodospira sibirica TaxID=154347 RepID=UPI00022C0555|nr:MotA/TolQ/ExbB proton channel family protein [Thiorhodospira sibirica]
MNIALVFEHGDWVLIGVFLTLFAMSVITWALIFNKSLLSWRLRRGNAAFAQAFWQSHSASQALWLAHESKTPLAEIAQAGLLGQQHYRRRDGSTLQAACSMDEFLVRAIRNAMTKALARQQSGLTFLASVGSTAPFIGLFGTVWGIYNALMDIAAAGSASMDVVAGPLGEALVATAAGLAAAIPAVLAYNAFNRFNRTLSQEMDAFAYDLHAYLTTGSAVNMGASETSAPPATTAMVEER